MERNGKIVEIDRRNSLKFLIFSFALLFLVLSIGIVSALNINVEEIKKDNVVISEIGNPADYEFIITNNDDSGETIEIYSLVGVQFSPRGTFDIGPGENKIDVSAYLPDSLLRNKGFINFEYQIKGSGSDLYRDDLIVKIVSIDEVFEIDESDLKFEESDVDVSVRNVQNLNLEDVSIVLKSEFFDFSVKGQDFEPFERKNFTIPLNSKDFSRVIAGTHVISGEFEIKGKNVKETGIVNYLEKEDILISDKSSGIIIRTNDYIRENKGNKAVSVKIEAKRDIITRLFTIFSEEPDVSERRGLFVNYEWNKEIQPGETYSVEVSSNYTFPLLLFVIVFIIGAFVRIYTMTSVKLDKKVSFVKTRGGEFALRVKLVVKARKHVDSVELIDTLPTMTKLYEKFGRKPDKTDEKTRRMSWNIGSLNSGEERVLSYIIYSKVRAVGRFELPSATAVYSIDGKTEEVFSNKAFFVSEIAEED